MKPYSKIPFYSDENLDNSETLQQITNQFVEILNKYCSNFSLYCFGIKQESNTSSGIFDKITASNQNHWKFSALLIAENLPANTTANLIDLVSKDSNGRIECTLICYSPKQISVSNNEHLHFFSKVIQSGWLVHGSPYELAKLQLTDLPELDISSIETYCINRITIAEHCIELIRQSENDSLVKGNLLHSIVEQLCLSILYCFAYYHPNHFHLDYLLKFCSLFTFTPEKYFLKNPVYNKQLRSVINTGRHELRFRNAGIYAKEDLIAAKSLCLGFADEMIPIIENQLDHLKKQRK
ncbi:MAG: hypothetical protein ABGW91_08530 [Christiangramia sp.]